MDGTRVRVVPSPDLIESAYEGLSLQLGKLFRELDRILAVVAPLAVEHVPLLQAVGRVVAEPVWAQESVPPFRNSAMACLFSVYKIITAVLSARSWAMAPLVKEFML